MITFETTLEFIKKAHYGQLYGVTEYWEHPLAVANLGSNLFGDKFTEEAKLVALLHDVIEDTEYKSKDLLEMGYSKSVVHSVELLSKDTNLSYVENINRIIDSNDLNAIMVKYSDNMVNYSSMGDLPEDYQWMKNRYEKSISPENGWRLSA